MSLCLCVCVSNGKKCCLTTFYKLRNVAPSTYFIMYFSALTTVESGISVNNNWALSTFSTQIFSVGAISAASFFFFFVVLCLASYFLVRFLFLLQFGFYRNHHLYNNTKHKPHVYSTEYNVALLQCKEKHRFMQP